MHCEPPVLRQVIDDLVRATATAPSKLLRVEIARTIKGVRLTFVSSRDEGRRAPDPFEPALFDLPSGHPGIDLRLATVRRLVEARDGTVGFRDRKRVRRLWIELRGG